MALFESVCYYGPLMRSDNDVSMSLSDLQCQSPIASFFQPEYFVGQQLSCEAADKILGPNWERAWQRR